jgi:hypothetical protein
MKKLALSERLEYWKYQCAELTFDDAQKVAEYLIEHKDHPLMYQLLTSLYVLYGRHFKRGDSRISEDLVPPEYLNEHKLLLNLWDKVFAHIDTDGLPDRDIDHLNKVLLRVRHGKAFPAIASNLPEGFRFESIRDLCAHLSDFCHKKAEEKLCDAMDGSCPPDLDYEIDLREGDRFLIKPVELGKNARRVNLNQPPRP